MTPLIVPITRPQEWRWMQSKCGVIACEDSRGIIAIDEKGYFSAGFVADQWTKDSCQVHIAVENPMVLRHGFLETICHFIFTGTGRKRVFALIPANNSKSLKFGVHMGLKEVTRIPDGYETGIDYVVLTMTKESCPWLEQQRKAA